MKTVSIETILNKLGRELRGTSLHETDIIEMIGEALEFMKVYTSLEQRVDFLIVEDYETTLPNYTQKILQVAQGSSFVSNQVLGLHYTSSRTQTEEDLEQDEGITDILLPVTYSYGYDTWIDTSMYRSHFIPIRLANHTFFNSIVCREKKEIPYSACIEEYTIVDNRLRFSFKEGVVALSYVRTKVDSVTGYPLIPDNISYITAITYYVKWKLAEKQQWERKEGMDGLTSDLERKWLKYCRQAKNSLKMPNSIDDLQDLLEQSHNLVPNHKNYYSFFGALGKEEYKFYNK